MTENTAAKPRRAIWAFSAGVLIGMALTFFVMRICYGATPRSSFRTDIKYRPHMEIETGGLSVTLENLEPWPADVKLSDLSDSWSGMAKRNIAAFDRSIAEAGAKLSARERIRMRMAQVMFFNADGQADAAYELLKKLRSEVETSTSLAREMLFTLIYLQGVTALRIGENDNCIMCRGESSCILPISPAAVHTNQTGSRTAIAHFAEYLSMFPDSPDIKWLLNVAHMTLGEHPDRVDPRYLVDLGDYKKSEFDIGRFRDIGHAVGVNRFGQAGGSILDDFDNDGRLDLFVTCWEATQPAKFYRNKGDGTFEDQSKTANVEDQLGGLFCCQADYDNDGNLDIFIARGAWLPYPIRPSLLRNTGGGKFIDVTESAGLIAGVNANSAAWADYDNDGWLDLFVPGERAASLLYHNRGDGTFENVAISAGVDTTSMDWCKGVSWIDFDNDRYPDLFLNFFGPTARLFRNNRDGSFSDVTSSMGISAPTGGFSCWTWDYDNDGWLDILATSYERSIAGIVEGLVDHKDAKKSTTLYRNLGGSRFEDVSAKVGVNKMFAAMGSNFGDFDNDGYLDFYLGTGDPSIGTLVPNRMFKNVDGSRFAEITTSSGTGHLQKGHAVSCGDWDRDGDVDIFIQMGGAVDGDKYHSILFQNPGQGNQSLTLRLKGTKTNRAAIGARIKAVIDDPDERVVHALVSSGSSFGANTLEQTIGMRKAARVKRLEVYWPTSDTTQVFENVNAGQVVEITEGSDALRLIDVPRIDVPETSPTMSKSANRR